MIFIFFRFIYSKVFLCSLVQSFWPVRFVPTNFAWKSQVPLRIKSFAWLVAHKKVNTNDMLQLKRSYKALSLDVCMLCMEYEELVDYLLLHCSLIVGLWHKLFGLTKLDWVPSKSICDMMTIAYKDWEVPVEDWYCGEMLVWLWFALCGGKEMPEFLGIRRGLKRFCGIQFISLFPFWSLAPQILRAFPLIWFNSIECWRVGSMVWASKERLFCVFPYDA